MWDEIPIEIINNLIDSFPDRIKACKLLAGESINEKKEFIREFRASYQSGLLLMVIDESNRKIIIKLLLLMMIKMLEIQIGK